LHHVPHRRAGAAGVVGARQTAGFEAPMQSSPDMPGRKERRKLTEQVDVQSLLRLSRAKEQAWIDVIRKMDEVYADLIRYEVELEEKNAALEDAQRLITGVLASMSDVLIVCDVQGRIQRVNKA